MEVTSRERQVRKFVEEVWNGRTYEAAAALYDEKYISPFGVGTSARAEPIHPLPPGISGSPRGRGGFHRGRRHGRPPGRKFRGTDTGGYVGRAPTGRSVEEWAVTIMHFEGDKVVREWIGADKLGLFIQLGVLDDPWQADPG